VFLFSGHHERQVDEHGLRGGRAEAVHRTDPRHFGREEDRHVGHHGLLPGRSTGEKSYKTLFYLSFDAAAKLGSVCIWQSIFINVCREIG